MFSKTTTWRFVAFGAIAVATVSTGATDARDNGRDVQQNSPVHVERSAPVTPTVFEGDLRDLPQIVEWQPGDPVREIPRRYYPKPGMVSAPDPITSDPLVPAQQQAAQDQTESVGSTFTTPTRSFDGIGFTGVNPPDPSGAAGPNHYIQSINGGGGSRVRIFDKAEPTPGILSTFTMDTLGSGACASGFSDPIVIYDRQADRWVMSEFANAGNNLCVYVSQTGDPVTGGWYAYQFTTPSFPDYPKYATWPTDANSGDGSYVVTANDGGPGVFALDRGNMIDGNPATFIRLTIPGLPGFGFEAPTPADLDGAGPPPSGAPAVIMRHRDTESHSGPAAPADLLEMWAFDVDWNNTSNTTLTQQASIDVAEFDSTLCGLSSFNCFPQPGTGTTLDPLREVIMYRLQYMHHSDGTETVIGSFVVDTNGSNRGGVRWFELRGGFNNWALHQEGTYSIDTDNRFMSSAAMDQSKNIAVAYNVSSSSTFPSLRYTGRQSGEPLGAMTETESVIFNGTASNASNRYGDYSHMSLDPEDDCTFWFTGEANASSSWKTQIASFRFTACGCELLPAAPVLTGSTNGDNRIDLQWDDSDLESVTTYEVLRSRTPGGPYEKIVEISDTSPGAAEGLDYSFSDFDVSGGIDYYYVVRSTDGLACSSQESNELLVTATGACTLEPVFSGVNLVDDPNFGVCRLDIFWGAATPECGGPVTYNVYRSLISGFVPSATTLVASGLTGNSYSDVNQLVDGTNYFYVVRAVDAANGTEDGNTVQLVGEPDGVGGNCTPGSSCADNPLVNVEPEGPLTVCQNGGPTLTANLSGGSGPFTYQWFDNGQPIPGATAATFAPTSLGTHSYNVRVSADTCGDDVFDGLDTAIERVNEPSFSGLTSATNAQTADCSVDLAWDAAVSVCPGPLTYSVFRSTSNPATPSYENLVAGGLAGTTYSDESGLQNVQEYFYLVKAYESSTTQFDSNTVTLSVAPDGPGSGFSEAYFEDFEDPATFADWTTTKGPGVHNCGVWGLDSAGSSRPAGSTGDYVIADNNCTPAPQLTSTKIDSPVIDMALPGLLTVDLEAKIRFDYSSTDGVETASVEVWDGTQWIAVWTSGIADVNTQLNLDVSAYAIGNSGFRVRFNYQDAVDDNYFSFDDVRLTVYSVNACTTAAGGPPSVPRGSVLVDKNGSGVDLTWDASCGASDYNLLFGDLANVSSYTLQGGVCSLGGSGNFPWNSLPAGDLYFMIVGVDGAGTESSWGTDRGFAERNGGVSSGQCGVTAKDATNICF